MVNNANVAVATLIINELQSLSANVVGLEPSYVQFALVVVLIYLRNYKPKAANPETSSNDDKTIEPNFFI